MAEIDSYRAGRFELVGEIEAPRRRSHREVEVPSAIWPGTRSDMASLERNAEEWRREERRQAVIAFMRRLFRR
ncbi:hypothetical protein [Rhizobium sp. C4]|uniref:hypothetical protein n=1 Tax=Rhizobium sp. C4 TaxID=1349800 RepID=UPI001E3AE047|nr:hypothetical protein [Rhizobium sp. C4]MCD2174047.1 hypothetical protein [Rhizobium sp. C4]